MICPAMMDTGDFEANLAAAAGGDPALRAELAACFAQSVAHQVDLLHRSRCDANWDMAARRLKGLGASFHAAELCRLAEEAIDSAPGDPVILRKLAQFSQKITAAN